MFKLWLNELLSPIDTSSGGDTAHPAGAMDLLSELMKDDEETEIIDLGKKDETPIPDKSKTDTTEEEEVKDDEDEDDEEKKEEVDELAELEEELKGPSEDKLQLMTPSRRKDILKDFPELFKKHPYLEVAYYRDQKFTELFPTIKDAEEASETLKTLTEYRDKVSTGDVEIVMTDLQKDKQSFAKMVDGLLPTLAKVNNDAYLHILSNLSKDIVENMFKEGKATENDSLKNAAAILHQYLFGTSKWEPKKMYSGHAPEQDATTRQADDELAKREKAFFERKFMDAQESVFGKIDNAVKATIEQNIDPKKVMTDYVRNTAIDKAIETVGNLMQKDTRFKSLLDKLWENAAKKDFAKPEMEKIRSACVSKARTLLAPVIKSARHDALKGMGKRVVEDKSEDSETSVKPGSSATPRNSGRTTSKSGPKPGQSTLDYLMED